MKNTPIASKTISVSSIIVIFIQLTTLLLFSIVTNQTKQRIVNQQALSEISSIQLMISESYTLGDIVSLRRYLDAYSKLNSWRYGQLMDNDKNVLWKSELDEIDPAQEISFTSDITTANGGKIGTLSIKKNIRNENEKWSLQLTLSLGFIMLMAIIGLVIQNITLMKVLKPVSDLSFQLQQEAHALEIKLDSNKDEDDIYLVKKWFSQIANSWKIEKENAVRSSKYLAVARLATQVSHDIRSPLAALEMISGSINELPEEKRIIVRSAINRIRDIANSLLKENKKISDFTDVSSSIPDNKNLTTVLLAPTIETIISEKRGQYRSLKSVAIDFLIDAKSYGIFAKIIPDEFQRALSNLIDNAVESLDEVGTVDIQLSTGKTTIQVKVKDSGKGIPEEIVPKLGIRGNTFNKTGGNGLGLAYSKEVIESFNGRISIKSELKNGTEITITLPKEPPPGWFVPNITITKGQTLVVLDDDHSVHKLWNEKFSSSLGNKEINLLFFDNPNDLKIFYRKNFLELENALFLLDFEIARNIETGLDVIELLGLQKQSILITSHYEDSALRLSCEKMGVRLIPKIMCAFVPIDIS